MSEDGFWRDLWVVQVVRSLRGGVLPAALETVAVAVYLQDVHMVSEAVQQRSGEPLRAKDFRPLVEGQVGGDQDGSPLIALREDLEDQFGAGPGKWNKAQFVDDQQVEPRQLPLQVEQTSFVPWPPSARGPDWRRW